MNENENKDQQKHYCAYCGQEAKYQFKNGNWCCHKFNTQCPANKLKNSLKNKALYKSGKRKSIFLINPNYNVWNKGLTKFTDDRLKKFGQLLHNKYESGQLINGHTGKKISDNVKNKISQSMKKAHSEGRAHNIGECRWNNQPSFPQKFFMQVIENEFTNKNYTREFPFKHFSLDFAWVELKKNIEIDGQQHQSDLKQKERDIKKDKLLEQNGWKCLRIKWKQLYHNTKYWINIAKNFIEAQ